MSTLQAASNVEAQIEEVRRILSTVCGSLKGSAPASAGLEELIRTLLIQGVTLRDIAFLIEEAVVGGVE